MKAPPKGAGPHDRIDPFRSLPDPSRGAFGMCCRVLPKGLRSKTAIAANCCKAFSVLNQFPAAFPLLFADRSTSTTLVLLSRESKHAVMVSAER